MSDQIILSGGIGGQDSMSQGVLGSAKVTTWSSTPVWSYAQQAFIPSSQPTDVVVIRGSATKTLKIQSIIVSAESATASVLSANIIRRTTAATGGTSAALLGTPHDISDGSGTASVLFYSVSPTAVGTAWGGGNGFLGSQQLICGNGGAVPAIPAIWNFGGTMDVKPIILRGINDYICINLGGLSYAAIPTLKLDIEIDIEEDNSVSGG